MNVSSIVAELIITTQCILIVNTLSEQCLSSVEVMALYYARGDSDPILGKFYSQEW